MGKQFRISSEDTNDSCDSNAREIESLIALFQFFSNGYKDAPNDLFTHVFADYFKIDKSKFSASDVMEIYNTHAQRAESAINSMTRWISENATHSLQYGDVYPRTQQE